jgi:probable rRNA maturation factor
MSHHTVEIQIDNRFRNRVSSDALHRAAQATLEHEGQKTPIELAIAVADDETLRQLNRRHLGEDVATDVLAFPNETRGPFVSLPRIPQYLGDVIVSFSRAETQAAEADHDVQTELQLLVVHGLLHLLGYEDAAEEERDRMWALQAEILSTLDVVVHLPA